LYVIHIGAPDTQHFKGVIPDKPSSGEGVKFDPKEIPARYKVWGPLVGCMSLLAV